ncbi:DNRLRE domain-containing protein [Aeoliella sp.]|uniref:DNRLRE domain-containing protein n=1 Tax=Aeoliella sp. TaxID=2795800 RepID=UPI003CCBAB11
MSTRCVLSAILVLPFVGSAASAVVVSFQEGVSPTGAYQMHGAYARADDDPDQNRGGISVIQVGYISEAAPATYGYLGWDVSAIPFGSTINSATLTLTTQAAGGGEADEDHDLRLHEMIGSFDETTVTYDNRDFIVPTPWSTPGGDFSPTPVSSIPSINTSTITEGQLLTFASSAAFTSAISSAVSGSGTAYFVIDSNSNNDTNANRNLFRIHSDDADASDRPLLEIDYTIPLEVTVDRSTGGVSIENVSGSPLGSILGYSLLSEAGGLDRDNWNPIKGQYDGSPGGDQSFDSNSWTILEGDGGPYDLSEGVFDGSGGTLAAGATLDLGVAWLRSPFEDVTIEILFDDGTPEGNVSKYPVTFVPGANNLEAVEFGDLDFDGDIDDDDFNNVFVPAFLTDTSGLSPVQAYQAADLNADGITDVFDFIIFNRIYKQQPGAGTLQFPGAVGVPEPTSLALLAVVGIGLAVARRRQVAVAAVVGLLAMMAVPASAVTVRNMTTGELLFHDDFESAPEVTAFEYGAPENAGLDADPMVPLGSPAGSFWFSPFRRIDNTTDNEVDEIIQVTSSTTGDDPGPFYGNNYLRAVRDGDQTLAHPVFTEQTTIGQRVRLETMVRTLPNSPSSGGANLTAWGKDGNGDVAILISMQFAQDGEVRNTDGTSGSNSTSAVSGLNYVEGEWNFVAVDYAVGGSTFDLTVNDQTVTGLGFRNNETPETPTFPVSINAFGFAGQNVTSGFDRRMYVDDAPELTLRVNQDTGDITLVNDLSADLTIDTYRITSATADALVPGSFSGLDGAGYDGGAWTAFSNGTTQYLAEAALGDSTIGMGDSVSLGAAYNTTTLAEDLVFEIHVAGSLDTMLIPSYNIEYITGLPGDFNVDGIVNLADYTVWRNNLGASDAALGGNGDNTDGLNTVNAADYMAWKDNFGASSGAGAVAGLGANVPEPSTLLLLAGVLGTAAFCRRRASWTAALTIVVACVASSASAVTTTTAQYLFGDGGDNGSDGTPVTLIWEEQDASGLNDLQNVVGDPTYELVADLGGGYVGSGTYAVDFDGDDALLRGEPSDVEPMEDNYFLRLNSIVDVGVEMWVYPRNNSARQVLMYNERNDVGVAIDGDGMWSQVLAGHDTDGDIVGHKMVETNQWTHIMQHTYAVNSPGAPAFVEGSGTGGQFMTVLYVNGEAVSAHIDNHGLDTSADLVFGAYDTAGTVGAITATDFYDGAIDGARFYRTQDFNLFTDNISVLNEINVRSSGAITNGVVTPGDMNLDGTVDATDEALFAASWKSKNLFEGFHGDLYAGDLDTWQDGDFNLDGIVNLHDLSMIHDTLAPLGGFNFALLEGAAVPEPSTSAILLASAAFGLAYFRRQP